MRRVVLVLAAILCFSGSAYASRSNPWDVQFGAAPEQAPRLRLNVVFTASDLDQGTTRTKAVDYGPGYSLRHRVHRIASFATLPLFAAEYLLGQELYDGTGSGTVRSAHGAVAGALGALFAVNTVTGGWNLWTARKDPEQRTRRWLHGILMLAADAGFLATASLAPDDDDDEGEIGGGDGNRSTHRSVAILSIGTATVSYLLMLLR